MDISNTNGKHRSTTFMTVVAILAAGAVLAVAGLIGGNADVTSAHAGAGRHADNVAATSSAAVKQRRLYTGMRTLWSQHMAWTYAVVSSFATDSPALQADIDRLLRNQKDIGKAIKPYYGRAASQRLTDLLTEHIKLAVPVLTAAKGGDNVALGKAVADWQVNARQIGTFLAKANPAWKSAPKLLKAHIDGTIVYASDAIKGDHAKAIAAYDKAEKHMLMLADALSAGIVKQFPRRFR